MAHLLVSPKFRPLDANGDIMPGAKLYSYAAGTSTPLVTYSNKTGTANDNPCVLDANGEADVWLGASAYKLTLKTSTDVTLYTVDNISHENAGAIVTAQLADGILSADATGLLKMADGYLAASTAGRLKMGDGYVNTAKLASGALSADATGLLKMADGYLAASAGGLAKMADGFLAASAGGLAKMADGFLAASSAGRAKMADGFMTVAKLADGILSADATGRAKMADLFLTAPKIANNAVTTDKLAGKNIATSSTCGAFTRTASSYAQITNFSRDITVIARPVKVIFNADGTNVGCWGVGVGGTGMIVRLTCDGADVGRVQLDCVGNHGPGAVTFYHLASAGVHTYAVSMLSNDNVTTMSASYMIMRVEEDG